MWSVLQNCTRNHCSKYFFSNSELLWGSTERFGHKESNISLFILLHSSFDDAFEPYFSPSLIPLFLLSSSWHSRSPIICQHLFLLSFLLHFKLIFPHPVQLLKFQREDNGGWRCKDESWTRKLKTGEIPLRMGEKPTLQV